MRLRCLACGLFLELRSVAPTYCPRCLAKHRRAVELVAAAPDPPPAPQPGRDRRDRLTAALALARAETAMDVAVLGEIRDGREIVRSLDGDGTSFGLEVGDSLPVGETYCDRLLEGQISNIVHDVQADRLVSELRLTREARIGAYIGVPISAVDARLYVLCCLAHEQRPRLGERDVLFLRGVAEAIIAALDTTPAG
jgi:GAF domain-containing protein